MTPELERLARIVRDRYHYLTGSEITDAQAVDISSWVLTALREPTEGVVEAGYAATCQHDYGDTVPSTEIAPATWRAMLDHILGK